MSSSSSSSSPPAPWKGFVNGGLAAAGGAAVSHPLDVLKTRLQVQGEGAAGGKRLGPVGMASSIVKAQGIPGLYAGLSASILRQLVYSSTRFGVYDVVKRAVAEPDGSLSFPRKVAAGLFAGGVGAAVGNPCDLALVRMQADGRLPEAQRRNYTSVFNAIARITREEGVLALWNGCGPTVNRAMIVTAAQLASYDQLKQILLQNFTSLKDDSGTHMMTGVLAGFVASVASNPVDVIKTRVMNQKIVDGVKPYTSSLDCAVKTIRAEGPLALYKGFVPTFVRQAPYVVTTFVILEQLKKLY